MSAAGVLTELSRPISADGLVTALPTLEAEAVYGLLQLLLNGQMLTAETESGSEEDADARLATWAPHDLLFHARSRFGRNTGPFGASFRFVGRIPSLPAVKPKPAGETIPLDKPDLDSAMKSDPPLAAMMEERRSIYEYGSQPISIRQLGEFLYRVARVREVHRTQLQAGRDGATIEFLETTSRPYPSGGKSYDLEFYLAVDRCEGLSSGLYHYDPLGHGLTRVREADDRVEALLHYVSVAAPGSRPQVLIILASRFQRLSWKYDAIAYAATLKHVGVLFQSMYLVATAMGLAGSALGSGDADLFAEAAGTDYLSETSVGEFMLGSAPDQTAEREANGK
jgi:SagB-type dehydrogenase family enzyme